MVLSEVAERLMMMSGPNLITLCPMSADHKVDILDLLGVMLLWAKQEISMQSVQIDPKHALRKSAATAMSGTAARAV
jgi:hypothetical protein